MDMQKQECYYSVFSYEYGNHNVLAIDALPSRKVENTKCNFEMSPVKRLLIFYHYRWTPEDVITGNNIKSV